MTTALAAAATVALIAMLAAVDSWRRKRKIETAFAGRPLLNAEQFYETYFQQKGVPFPIVDGVRSVLEQQLSADLSRMMDADDFSKNLRFFWDFDSMADIEIVCALERKFSIAIADDEAERTHTVADIIGLVHQKVGDDNGAAPASSTASQSRTVRID